MAELHDELAVVLVDFLAHRAPEGDLVVVVDHRVVGQNPSGDMDGDERGDNRPTAAAGELLLPVDARLRPRAIVIIPTARDAGAEQTIFHGQVTKYERLKNDIIRWCLV